MSSSRIPNPSYVTIAAASNKPVTTGELAGFLTAFRNVLLSLPIGASSPTPATPSAAFQSQVDALQNEIAQTNQINNLSNVTLTSPSIVSPSVSGLSTSQVGEGSNLYFTNTRVASYINSSSTIPTASGTLGTVLSWNGSNWASVSTSSLGLVGSGGLAWGSITGTLANQTDLQTALNGKLGSSTISSLTTNFVPKWTGSAFANSLIFDNGTNVGIGTTSPGSIFSVAGVANWTGATTTYYASGGINLAGGCFAIAGACVGGASSQWATAGSNISYTTGNVGIGTTTPGSLLSLGSIANFTTATSTLYSSGGINLAGGCFAIAGNCIAGSNLLATANVWPQLQTFNGGASTTLLSVYGPAYFGGTATSTFGANGSLTVAGSLTAGTSEIDPVLGISAPNVPIDPITSYHAAGTIATTTGSVAASSQSLTVASAAGWSTGEGIDVAGAGAGGADLITSVTGISGTTFTLAAAAGTSVSNVTVNHDDTAAIAAAISAAISSGRPIHLRAGNYNVTSGFTINNPITLYGDGPAPTIVWNRSTTATIFTIDYYEYDPSGNWPTLTIQATIRDFQIAQASGITPTAGGAFEVAPIAGASNYLRGLTLQNITMNNLWNGVTTGNDINMDNFNGLYISNGAGSYGIVVNSAGSSGANDWNNDFLMGASSGLEIIQSDTQSFTNLTTDTAPIVFNAASQANILRVRFVNLKLEDTSGCAVQFGTVGASQTQFVGGEIGNTGGGQQTLCGNLSSTEIDGTNLYPGNGNSLGSVIQSNAIAIGTTTPDPTTVLDVIGNGDIDETGNNSLQFYNDGGVASGTHEIANFFRFPSSSGNAGLGIFYNANGSTANLTYLYAPGGGDVAIGVSNNGLSLPLYVKATGNVGIGTTTPLKTLSVAGSVDIDGGPSSDSYLYYDPYAGSVNYSGLVITPIVGATGAQLNLAPSSGSNVPSDILLDAYSSPSGEPRFGIGGGFGGAPSNAWSFGSICYASVDCNGWPLDFVVSNASGGRLTAMTIINSGNVGIDTTNPYSRLQVTGPDTASTSAFAVVNSASTTEFAVYDTGNAVLSGGLTQNSDQRLKTNVQSLDASSSLAVIESLNPVSFNWIDDIFGGGEQLGFIAQDVQKLLPQLVSTTSPTALTPNGTLGLNYTGLIAPIVGAIQALASELSSLENTVAGFAQSITTQVVTAATGNFSNELCVGSTCVTPAQFQAMVAAAGQAGTTSGQAEGAASAGGVGWSTPPVGVSPIIQINGDNPAIVQVGATYNDLGATVTGPQQDLNLGIQTYLNGSLESPIVVDTSEPATDTIAYVVTDPSGLTSTSTRTISVVAPSEDSDASSTPATTTATSTP